MELCLNPDLIKKWKRVVKRESKEAMKRGEPFDPSSMLEVKFLKNLIEEFLEVLICKNTRLVSLYIYSLFCITFRCSRILKLICLTPLYAY